MNIVQNVMHL